MTVEATPEQGPQHLKPIARQVSQEMLSHGTVRGSPVQCVSEFDKVASDPAKLAATTRNLVENLLQNPTMYEHHKYAVRLEAELHPLRLILSRLMAHPTYNRKGLFNTPVDPVALNLPDYFKVVKRPMDLGTVKTRLHSISYSNRQQVIDDIRLVFSNAMTYNPPFNPVHLNAKALLEFFQDQLVAFVPSAEECGQVASAAQSSGAASFAETKPPPLGTRQSPCHLSEVPAPDCKRRRRGTKQNPGHCCQFCKGMQCSICDQGCLALHPTLLICNGPQCMGSGIRKGGTYFIAPDGSKQYCERCYSGLSSVLLSGKQEGCRYKRDLLKRKNDEEIVEQWHICVECGCGVHQMCALRHAVGGTVQDEYLCPECSLKGTASPSQHGLNDLSTYLAGAEDPVAIKDACLESQHFAAEHLEETPMSRFIQSKVREVMKNSGCPGAEKTVLVRVISDCNRSFIVPEILQKHFCARKTKEKEVPLPQLVDYRSKAIMMFQKIDGMDVCIFCMYVHEYEGEKTSDEVSGEGSATEKRVYIAYLDSVEYFRPPNLRTLVYREILISYLATARKRGYETAHIWACPPSRGNSFVFWNHPASQKTPNEERLQSWYNAILSKAMEDGVVTDVKSLYESRFQGVLEEAGEQDCGRYKHCGRMVCPPLLDGDFWIDEAIRLHNTQFARYLRAKTGDGHIAGCNFPEVHDSSPVADMAKMIRDRIIAHPDAALFRRPVNAAALNLKDYHTIVTSPMDLGTMYFKCVFGEYVDLSEVVGDFKLMVSNAKRYNPKGHFVHTKADDLSKLFFAEVEALGRSWGKETSKWEDLGNMGMSLDVTRPEASAGTHALPSAIGGNEASPHTPAASSSEGNCPEGNASTPVAGSPPSSVLSPDIKQLMVGSDTWLLRKTHTPGKARKPPTTGNKGKGAGKKTAGRRRKSCPNTSEPASKRRRQSWLGEELGASVRRMRLCLFECNLSESAAPFVGGREEKFALYAEAYRPVANADAKPMFSRIADARQSLLEFSQNHHLEFDTLRRSKFSTAMLLHHLRHDDVPGLVPTCTDCRKQIEQVRWHKIGRVVEQARVQHASPLSCKKQLSPFVAEELCRECFDSHSDKEDFIPIQVLIK